MSMNARTMTFGRKPTLRSLVVLAAVAVAVLAAPVLEWTGVGLTAATFADDGDQTIRAAGYAFSIWGVIYLGMVIYGVWQLLPTTKETPELAAVAWPSAIAMAGCGAWLVAAALDIKAATVVIITLSAAAMIGGLLAARRADGQLWPEGHRVIFWPLGLLGGWLTIASALNILTVLTSWGVIGPDTALVWALGGVAAVVLVGGAVLLRLGHMAYGLPIAWGLAAVHVAERGEKPVLAWSALAASGLMLALSLWAGRRRRG